MLKIIKLILKIAFNVLWRLLLMLIGAILLLIFLMWTSGTLPI